MLRTLYEWTNVDAAVLVQSILNFLHLSVNSAAIQFSYPQEIQSDKSEMPK